MIEFLVLEAAQAGLSWSIVLKNRKGIDVPSASSILRKWRDTPRNNPEAHIGSGDHSKPDENRSCGTQRARSSRNQEELGSFDAYCWRFVDGQPKLKRWSAMREIPATSRESDAFSKDLKQRGLVRPSFMRTCRRSA